MALENTERYNDPRQVLQTALDGHQADIWTALPGIIQSFDSVSITAVVQPAIQALYTGANLQTQLVNLPLLTDVPVVFPRGGTYTLTFPIAAGDECLIIFGSRCIDNWWAQGGVQSQFELRMHDLSDGFAIVGPYSQKTKIENISTTTVQLRTNDGTLFTELDQPNDRARTVAGGVSIVLDGKANSISVTAPVIVLNASSQLNINSPLTRITGKVIADGDISGAAISLDQHIHANSGGSGNGGPPVPGT